MPARLGRLLIAGGLVLSLAALASGLADSTAEADPFGPSDESGGASQGLAPIVVPETSLAGPLEAPTLLPAASEVPNRARASQAPASATAHSRFVTRLPPTASATASLIWTPDRIVIPAIQLDAPVVPAELNEIEYIGVRYQQWLAPDVRASGWHSASAPLGAGDNTVLNGHHNIHGEVFGHLADLQVGDLIWVYSGVRAFAYEISLINILPERWQTADVRLANAAWMQPARDERLTLITCWPDASNTHRLIIVALPASAHTVENAELLPRLTPHPPSN